MAYDLDHVLLGVGENNIPGVAPIGWVARKSDIDTWPTPPKSEADAATVSETTTYSGNFVMVAGKRFRRLYGTQGKGKLDFEKQGELDCESFINKAHLVHPTLKDEALLFSNWAKEDLVYILELIDSSERILIGHPKFRTSTKVVGTSGDAATSQIGITVDVECTSKWPLPKYSGTITEEIA